jgi:hypothetical protein
MRNQTRHECVYETSVYKPLNIFQNLVILQYSNSI